MEIRLEDFNDIPFFENKQDIENYLLSKFKWIESGRDENNSENLLIKRLILIEKLKYSVRYDDYGGYLKNE